MKSSTQVKQVDQRPQTIGKKEMDDYFLRSAMAQQATGDFRLVAEARIREWLARGE